MLGFSIKDLIDIVIVALMLYNVYYLMKKSGVGRIFTGIMIFVVIWFLVSKVLQLSLTSAILDQIISVGAIALVVIFQNEIRRFFSSLGAHQWLRNLAKVLPFVHADETTTVEKLQAEIITDACAHLSKQGMGALIVIECQDAVCHNDKIISNAKYFNADIESELIQNIFFKNSPLHDGAMLIRDNHIAAASAILPMTDYTGLPDHFGTRHRAAYSLTELSDALVIVVSEETGAISTFRNREYEYNITTQQLLSKLKELK